MTTLLDDVGATGPPAPPPCDTILFCREPNPVLDNGPGKLIPDCC